MDTLLGRSCRRRGSAQPVFFTENVVRMRSRTSNARRRRVVLRLTYPCDTFHRSWLMSSSLKFDDCPKSNLLSTQTRRLCWIKLLMFWPASSQCPPICLQCSFSFARHSTCFVAYWLWQCDARGATYSPTLSVAVRPPCSCSDYFQCPEVWSCDQFDRASPVAAARAWNSLPSFVTSASSLSTFKRHLKTFLFAMSFWWLWSLLNCLFFPIYRTRRLFCVCVTCPCI